MTKENQHYIAPTANAFHIESKLNQSTRMFFVLYPITLCTPIIHVSCCGFHSMFQIFKSINQYSCPSCSPREAVWSCSIFQAWSTQIVFLGLMNNLELAVPGLIPQIYISVLKYNVISVCINNAHQKIKNCA